jgi:hypothetical protein
MNTYKYHSYLYSLKDVEWFIFGSLTWADPIKREDNDEARNLRKDDLKRLFYLSARTMGLRSRVFRFYHATEWNAAHDCHKHFLIARKGLERVEAKELCDTMQNIWQADVGQSLIVPFDPRLGGVAYCLKKEYDDKGTERERYDCVSDRLLSLLSLN